MHPSVERIDRLVRARCPLIILRSPEEARVERYLLVDVAHGERPRTPYVWTISGGLQKVDGADRCVVAEDTADPLAALRWVLGNAPSGRDPKASLYVFKDLHPWAQRASPQYDPVIVRALRDAAQALIERHQTLVLLSPAFDVPADLEADVTVVDFPLPAPAELREQVEVFAERLPHRTPVDPECLPLIVRALRGLPAAEAEQCLAQAVVQNRGLDRRAVPLILGEKAQIIRKSGALEYYPEQASYADIGGLDLLKAWCRQAEAAFSAEAAEYGIEPPRGVLLVGVPGCGKSLTAKAIAGGTRPLLRLDVGALFTAELGGSESRMRQALQVAEAVEGVLWIDEIEKALGSGGGELDGGTAQRVLGGLLTWMQETRAAVLIVATANDIRALRPELVRRFGEVFFIDLPTEDERREIFAIHLAKRRRDPGAFDLDAAAAQTQDFAGSEIERVVAGALRRAFAGGGRQVTTEDLMAVARETVPLATTMAEPLAHMREWARRARPASSRQASGRRAAAQGRVLELE